MKYVCNPLSPIPKSADSHVRGWSSYWARMLGAEVLDSSQRGLYLESRDVVYWDHGVNFSGGLNSPGGFTDAQAIYLASVVSSPAEIVSLDIPMPDYAGMLESRLGKDSTSNLLTSNLVNVVRNRIKGVRTETFQTLNPRVLTIGDSHSVAYAPPGSAVFRTNGKTAYGFMKNPSEFLSMVPDSVEQVILCFGSIDIRHHLMRTSDPLEACRNLVEELHHQLIYSFGGTGIGICAPVPVEHEDRVVPKPGWYKESPFYGSRASRKMLTDLFYQKLRQSSCPYISPPRNWFDMDPERYAKEVMERPRGVHISPRYHHATMAAPWETRGILVGKP